AFSETAGIARDPVTGDLLVAEAGNIFKAGDGGIERVDPVALVARGFFVTENDLGGSVTDFVIASGSKGYAIVLDEALRNMLVAFDPSRQRPPRRLLVRTEFLPDVALPPHDTFSLGLGGSIVLEFTDAIVDGPGPDFTVFENAFLTRGIATGPPFAEPATVSVSADGEHFVAFPYALDQSPYYPGCAGIYPVFANADDP